MAISKKKPIAATTHCAILSGSQTAEQMDSRRSSYSGRGAACGRCRVGGDAAGETDARSRRACPHPFDGGSLRNGHRHRRCPSKNRGRLTLLLATEFIEGIQPRGILSCGSLEIPSFNHPTNPGIAHFSFFLICSCERNVRPQWNFAIALRLLRDKTNRWPIRFTLTCASGTST